MGSLTSRPKAPKQTVKITQAAPPAPAPSAAPPPSPAPAPVTPAPETAPEPSAEETQAAARVQSLLSRNRGLFGTVLTGFKGLLSPAEKTPHRKNLLGE